MFDIPKVIAHRGASGYRPENTFVAFEYARDIGCHWLEFDVQLARCGQLVVMHDHKLSRTTNARGKVFEQDYIALKELDAGSWFDSNYCDAKIPLFSDVLEFLVANNMNANIEIKPSRDTEIDAAKLAVELVKSCWPKDRQAPLFSSFSAQATKMLSDLKMDYSLGLLFNNLPEDWQEKVETYQPVSIHLGDKKLTSKKVAEIKQHQPDLAVLVFTVNTTERAEELYAWGVDGVFSDYPDKIA